MYIIQRGPPVTMRVRSGYADGIWFSIAGSTTSAGGLPVAPRGPDSMHAKPAFESLLDVRAEESQSEETCFSH
jgi:hypothetical protein